MVKLAIEVDEHLLAGLQNFLEQHGASQNLPGRVMAASRDAAGPHLMGWHLGEAAQEVNRFLERIGVGPEIPAGGSTWDLSRIQETLQLMLDEFNWQEGRIVDCGWEDRPEHWRELVKAHPAIFGRQG